VSDVSSLEARVADAVDADALVCSAQRLVRVPRWNGKERPAQELMAEFMEGVGLEVDAWEIPMSEVRAHPAYAAEIERDDPLGERRDRGSIWPFRYI
jgi:acetylornithine deacetylase